MICTAIFAGTLGYQSLPVANQSWCVPITRSMLHLMPRPSAAYWKALPCLPGTANFRQQCSNCCSLHPLISSHHPSRRRTLHTTAASDSALDELTNAVSLPSSSEKSEDQPSCPPAPELDMSALDIRVGRILQVDDHPEADKLYVEAIDVGEDEPRTIASGLKDFVSRESLKDRMVIVLCNLKPRKMRGVTSNGMLLCASNEAHDHVETLSPPSDAQPGERVFFGDGGAVQGEPMSPNQVQKKKVTETLLPELHTSTTGVAMWKDKYMLTRHGPVKAPTLHHARIS